MSSGSDFRPLNVVATLESGALHRNRDWLANPENAKLIEGQIAPGFTPNAQYDMSFFGGKTVQTGTIVPLYVGGSGGSGAAAPWAQSDISSIDAALGQALSDHNLETVMAQYFSAQPSMSVGASGSVANNAATLQQSDIETMVKNEFASGALTGDYASTLFCFLLSPGTRLFASDGSDSYNGLGGYHGSVSASGSGGTQTVYYAAGVYSETSGGVTNGIPAFDLPWKNVVATFYHEINEWRTDADVENATGSNVNGILGWYAQQYGEIGDIPITEAGQNLSEVFIEVALGAGSGTVPVQIMYSNYDHGPAAVTSAPVGSALSSGGAHA
jgi:hypothetical protein